ncbi:MAG: hypothetical protein RJA59_358 [Pseudomonadota bacterium]
MRALLKIGPFAFLAAVAAGLALRWDDLPARYPVHWGLGGVGWADLSVRSVAAPLVMGLVAVAWAGGLRRFFLANSSPAPDPSRARRLLVAVTISMQWFLAILFGLGAIPRQGPGLVVAGAVLGSLLMPVALVATHAGKHPPAEPERPPPPDGWLLVPRENGAGYSIRRGHPRAWQAIAVVAAGPLAIIAVALAM